MSDLSVLFDVSGVTVRSVDVGGLELVVAEAGVGGRPLLLVHGFTGCRDDWSPVIGRLVAEGWHVVAADNRGHGDSDRPADEAAYSIAQVAADCFAVADAVGWDRFTLLGHSLGGAVAQSMTVGRPERISALILMDTSHRAVPIAAEMVGGALYLVREHGVETLLEVMRATPDPLGDTEAYEATAMRLPGYREMGERNMLRTAPQVYAAFLEEITSHADHLEDLRAIACPTLVIVGDQDRPFVEPCERIAAAIPEATLRVIPDAAHSGQFENTEGWLDAVLPFLASLR